MAIKWKQFEGLTKENKKAYIKEIAWFDEMLNSYATTSEDVEFFIKWQSGLGKFGRELEDLLIGLYPLWFIPNNNTSKYIRTEKQIFNCLKKTSSFIKKWNSNITNLLTKQKE